MPRAASRVVPLETGVSFPLLSSSRDPRSVVKPRTFGEPYYLARGCSQLPG